MAVKTNPLEVRWNPESPIEDVKYTSDETVDPSLINEIGELRQSFGDELMLLGHYYQRDEVIRFADFTGDSLALSQKAADVRNIKSIIFLGVHFMAETADMLTAPDVPVILPDLRAGCTMADMAQIEDIEDAWAELEAVIDTKSLIPITYINSSAAVKAHVGRYHGAICTSSNAKNVITWALDKGEKLFFFPDQHLGRNTAYELGIPLDQMIIWDPEELLGGNSVDEIKKARVILWKGHCSVHQHFTPAMVDSWHQRDPEVKVIVHPECSFEVAQKADYAGSTAFIRNMIMDSPAGSKWAVGTENHLVARIGRKMAEEGKEVYSLAPYACLCSTMFRISPEALLNSLRALKDGKHKWRVEVDEETSHFASLALKQMFAVT